MPAVGPPTTVTAIDSSDGPLEEAFEGRSVACGSPTRSTPAAATCSPHRATGRHC